MPSLTYARCRRCGAPDTNETGLCDRCAEYTSLIEGESLRVSVVCSHCGQTFTEKKFERHRWSCFYRDRSLVIKGHRRRR